jgi:hypothetical protein
MNDKRCNPQNWRESSVSLPGTIALIVTIAIVPIVVFGGGILFEAI